MADTQYTYRLALTPKEHEEAAALVPLIQAQWDRDGVGRKVTASRVFSLAIVEGLKVLRARLAPVAIGETPPSPTPAPVDEETPDLPFGGGVDLTPPTPKPDPNGDPVKALAAFRKSEGVAAKVMAKRAGVSMSAWYQYEKGVIVPTGKNREGIARATRGAVPASWWPPEKE